MRPTHALLIVGATILLASGAEANPLPMPSMGASQLAGTQDVRVNISTTYSCPSGTIYRGTSFIHESGMNMLDLEDADTVAVVDVDCSMADSWPDEWSSGVTHYSVSAVDTCVPPGTYYYQLFSGDAPVTWMDDYGEVPQPLTVEEFDTSCLPAQDDPQAGGDCSIGTVAASDPGAGALALVLLGLLVAARRRV